MAKPTLGQNHVEDIDQARASFQMGSATDPPKRGNFGR